MGVTETGLTSIRRNTAPVNQNGQAVQATASQLTPVQQYDLASGSAPDFNWQQFLTGSYFATPANPAQALFFLQEGPSLAAFGEQYALTGQQQAGAYNLADLNNKSAYQLEVLKENQVSHQIDVNNQINQRQTNAGVIGNIVNGITKLFHFHF